MNSATQNAIENALELLFDTTHGDSDDVSKLTIKEVFAKCREIFCSINGTLIEHLGDENLLKERAKPRYHSRIVMVSRINPMVQIRRLLRLRRN